MARTLTVNYARIVRTNHAIDPTTNNDTITAFYVVGNKAADGTVRDYNHDGYQGIANGLTATFVSAPTNTQQQVMTALVNAIATQEGLNLAGGDTVALS